MLWPAKRPLLNAIWRTRRLRRLPLRLRPVATAHDASITLTTPNNITRNIKVRATCVERTFSFVSCSA
eukprot:1452842-Amphidinium_carterae.1